jgi:hypothetical protein
LILSVNPSTSSMGASIVSRIYIWYNRLSQDLYFWIWNLQVSRFQNQKYKFSTRLGFDFEIYKYTTWFWIWNLQVSRFQNSKYKFSIRVEFEN